MVRIIPKCSGNARFELQVRDISHGQEDFVDLYGTMGAAAVVAGTTR
jgi:hypothetical protein